MFNKVFGLKSKFSNKLGFSKFFSTFHSDYIVIGAGTAGVCTAAQLKNTGIVNDPSKNLTIFDPQAAHYFQPGYTQYAGGVFEDPSFMKKWVEYDIKTITQGLNFKNEGVQTIDPENNAIVTSNGDKWTYNNLIVAAGLQVNLNSIPGLKDLLDDPNSNVGTIYEYNNCKKVHDMRKRFKGGKALFTMAPPPVKCAGAPQKIAYLCDDYWKNNNVKADVHYFTPLGAIFGVKFFSDGLEKVADDRGIIRHYNTVLVSVKPGVATFKNNQTNTTYEESFDFLHAVPLQSAPDFLKGSPISNPAGFVEINQDMKHKKFNNVWAIGDCICLPNAKTAAAVFSQAPVLVHNLVNEIKQQGYPKASYDGYSSCPLFVGKNQLLLAEFKDWNCDQTNTAQKTNDETFRPGKQDEPSALYYYITKLLTYIYPLSFKGIWYGKNSIFKPNFKDPSKNINIRQYYITMLYAGGIGVTWLLLKLII